MPYIIETQRTDVAAHGDTFQNTLSRTAVATLEEARDYTFNARVNDDGQIEPLPESGGTIGPLPDGAVIEVRQVSRNELSADVGYPHPYFKSTSDIVGAFNAQHAA